MARSPASSASETRVNAGMRQKTMTIRTTLSAICVALCAAALTAHAVTSAIPAAGLPTASEYSTALLPERADVVSWRTLAQVEMVRKGINLVPSFSKDILGLDATDVKLQGFVIPLEVGAAQKHFLIAAVPAECQFCLPAGPEAMVEVLATTPVKFGLAPVVVRGRFSVLKDEAGGLLYRLSDAVPVGAAPPAAAATKPQP
jgi:hypothetical protein